VTGHARRFAAHGAGLRANPYLADELFVQVHRSAAGVAWRWRTELIALTITAAALWRLALLLTLTTAALVLVGLVVVVLGCPGRGSSPSAGRGA